MKRRGGVRPRRALELGPSVGDTDPGMAVLGGTHARHRGSERGRETRHVGWPQMNSTISD
jgi:hypothetical protein